MDQHIRAGIRFKMSIKRGKAIMPDCWRVPLQAITLMRCKAASLEAKAGSATTAIWLTRMRGKTSNNTITFAGKGQYCLVALLAKLCTLSPVAARLPDPPATIITAQSARGWCINVVSLSACRPLSPRRALCLWIIGIQSLRCLRKPSTKSAK